MKYLFFLLVLCNIVFYLWETGVGRSLSSQGREQAEAGERIVLLRELPAASHGAAEAPAKSMEEMQPPVAGHGNPSPQAVASAGMATDGQASQSPVEASPLAAAKTGETSAAPAQQTSADSPPPRESEEGGGQAQKAESCYRLGPYASPGSAQQGKVALGTGQGRVEMVKKATQMENGYWILYPPAEDGEAAQANRKMLVNKGFADVWVVDKGENRYAVSLGIAHTKDLAEDAVRRYRAKGVEAELKPRMNTAERWWLEVRGENRASLESAVGKSLAGSGAVQIADCD